ncbi:signal transduction histidine kinase [Actinocorallia herbida]|uniref:Signal transduction histidine kinase n=1 Tax=Actinocorallia herbida TaxID=58109 RepID=A0A3N1DCS2_9ACTN|nr:histidine kinase [Actinocorallia herbida]ROO90928.1 signal transduction histidine kinase [Actinocorallia herbida]
MTVVLVLLSFCAVYVLAAPSRAPGAWGAALAIAAVLALFVLQLRHVLYRWPGPVPLALQVVLTFTAVLCLDVSVGLFGLLAGSLLLTEGRAAKAGALLMASAAFPVAALRSGVGATALDSAVTAAIMALVVYGLTRLAAQVEAVAAARLTAAGNAAAEERLRIAEELRGRLDAGLAALAREAARPGPTAASLGALLADARAALAAVRTTAAEFRGLSLAPEVSAARTLLAAAGIEARVGVGHTEPLGATGSLLAAALREAVTRVVAEGTARVCAIETEHRDGRVVLRVSDDGVRAAERPASALDGLAERLRKAGGTLTSELGADGRFTVEASAPVTEGALPSVDRASARLSVVLLATVLVGFCFKGLLQTPLYLMPYAVVLLVAVCAVQLGWMRGYRRTASVLLLQGALSFLPLPWLGVSWVGAPGFFAGSLLIALPPAAAWSLTALVMAVVAGAAALLGQPAPVVVNLAVSVLVTGVVVRGLVLLARQVRELRAAGEGMARAAALQERLRAARDLHDLLGHNLAAVLLKCEVAARLLEADPPRARAELDAAAGLAERARADLRGAAGTARTPLLVEELESARAVLETAGIVVAVRDGGPVPDRTAAVLGPVLREAVTNVLKHGAAGRCEITVASGPGPVRLEVASDGLDPAARPGPPGAGLGNLATRLAAQGGALSVSRDGRWFRLAAELPPS